MILRGGIDIKRRAFRKEGSFCVFGGKGGKEEILPANVSEYTRMEELVGAH